ncbi:MAG: DUF4783 domain-containing protein [Bacteroidetes bacterium]|nr:DUF4783 domain-containing protein [Bacteroidota bacterium]
MKPLRKSFMLILSVAVIVCTFGFVSSPKGITDDISAAIRTGNAKELAKFFNSSIDVSIPGYEGIYSKVQAEQIMKDFFAKQVPKSFTIIHQGASKDGSQYSIGNYTTEKQTFRTYFLLKKTGEKFLLQQLRFEVEE